MGTKTRTGKQKPVSYRVLVVHDGGDCYVEPGHVAVRLGDEIVFHAVGTPSVTLFIPRGTVFNRGKSIEIIHVRAGQPQRVNVGMAPALAGSVHTYAAHCDRERTMARGGSHPQILIIE